MAWCFSTRASVAAVLSTHTCVSSFIWVKKKLFYHGYLALAWKLIHDFNSIHVGQQCRKLHFWHTCLKTNVPFMSYVRFQSSSPISYSPSSKNTHIGEQLNISFPHGTSKCIFVHSNKKKKKKKKKKSESYILIYSLFQGSTITFFNHLTAGQPLHDISMTKM